MTPVHPTNLDELGLSCHPIANPDGLRGNDSDPSPALGMTKWRVILKERSD